MARCVRRLWGFCVRPRVSMVTDIDSMTLNAIITKIASMNANIKVSQEDYETLRSAHLQFTNVDEVRLTRLTSWAVDIVCLAHRADTDEK